MLKAQENESRDSLKPEKNPQKQKINKETMLQNKMDEMLNKVVETGNIAIRKINESSQGVLMNRNDSSNDQSMSNANDQSMSNSNDQDMSNEIENIIFSDSEQDLELNNDDDDDDFLKELPKIFEDDEKFGDETTENINLKWLNLSQRKNQT